jgi:predicted patatin/cPLA2 family phospholipase
MKDKTAIICRGGGMRSAHGAGFLYTLATQLKIQSPDMIIGSSGNTGNVLGYATQKQDQYDLLKEIWTEHISTSKFISFSRPTCVMNIDYLVDTIFKGNGMLREGALESSPVEYYISIVDAVTGKARFIDRSNNVDRFELMRASKALPILYGKTVRILGKDYIDGAVGQTTQSQIDFAIGKGATRILFIDDSSKRTLFLNCITFFYALTDTKELRTKVLADLFTKRTHTVPEGVELLYVHRDKMPAAIMTRDKKQLTQTFECGVQDACELSGPLRSLFSK